MTYWAVTAAVVVVYDWVLTLEQEIELIWRQHWSLMTVLYLIIRYIGLLYSAISVLVNMPLVSVTDAGCNIIYYASNGTNVVVAAMLGIIIIARLHAMYQKSRTMVIFLVIIFLAVNISCGVIAAIGLRNYVLEELMLSGKYMCGFASETDVRFLGSIVWTLNTVWEVLTMCLSIWVVLKHFRDMRRFGPSTGSTIGDCFRVLIKSHVFYFASFVCVSCLELANTSPKLVNSDSTGTLILEGALDILLSVQMFVLGPRLILSVREYHAKFVADYDVETGTTSIVFQKHVYVPTSSTV